MAVFKSTLAQNPYFYGMELRSTKDMTITIIGAGNLATNLAIALTGKGFRIVQVVSGGGHSARQLAARIGATDASTLEGLKANADVYIIAVPDGSIDAVAGSMGGVNGVVLHTSGSTPLSVLNRINCQGRGVLYPFQTFTKERVVPFGNIPICIEGDTPMANNTVRGIAQELSARVYPMDSPTRLWLHITGVFACNFSNHLLAIANKLARERGIDYSMLQPLVEETIRKAFEGQPSKAQTGPAIRNDSVTIRKHLDLLKENAPILSDIYKLLTLSIQNFEDI